MAETPSPRPVDILFPEMKRSASILNRVCIPKPIGCGQPIVRFKDSVSESEYRISGLCQECQDNFFKET